MREEFHGINDPRQYKLLYGWGTLTTNIWLPSLSELVGTTGSEASNGCYFSAMQGLNTSGPYYFVDAQGGNQFAYFKQYNASSGGTAIMNVCNQESAWLRSSYYGSTKDVWRTGETNFGANYADVNSFAVHPAVGENRK